MTKSCLVIHWIEQRNKGIFGKIVTFTDQIGGSKIRNTGFEWNAEHEGTKIGKVALAGDAAHPMTFRRCPRGQSFFVVSTFHESTNC